MSEKGSFKADIPDALFAEALAAVGGKKPGPADEEVGGVTLEVEGDTAAEEGADASDAAAGDRPADTAAAAKIRALQAMLEDSMERAKQTADRLKETHDRYVRLAADFDNHKKRQAKEKEDTLKFAAEKLVKDLLPVVDNLDRALTSGGDAQALRDGVKLVQSQFLAALGKAGVQPFDSVGQPFDPSRHEALMQAESTTHVAGVVVQEFVRGYLLADRIARPAAVVVSKGPGPAAAVPPEGGETPA